MVCDASYPDTGVRCPSVAEATDAAQDDQPVNVVRFLNCCFESSDAALRGFAYQFLALAAIKAPTALASQALEVFFSAQVDAHAEENNTVVRANCRLLCWELIAVRTGNSATGASPHVPHLGTLVICMRPRTAERREKQRKRRDDGANGDVGGRGDIETG